MDIEVIAWIYIPILIGILEIIISGISLKNGKTTIGLRIFIIIALLNILAVYILVQILNGGWPTYTPHIIIGISTIILVTRKLMDYKNRKKTFANNG